MKKSFSLFVLSVLFLGASCNDDPNLVPEPIARTIPNVESDGKLFDSLVGQRSEVTSDPFIIRGTWRVENQLFVVVQYGGGCEEHEFDLVWDPAIILVPENEIGFDEAQLIITHDDNDDLCEAALTDTLEIELGDFNAVRAKRPFGVTETPVTRPKCSAKLT